MSSGMPRKPLILGAASQRGVPTRTSPNIFTSLPFRYQPSLIFNETAICDEVPESFRIIRSLHENVYRLFLVDRTITGLLSLRHAGLSRENELCDGSTDEIC